MESIYEKSNKRIQSTKYPHQRKIQGNINWDWRLNGLVGARGTGKTTLLLQKLREFQESGHAVLYIRLDDLYFTDHRIYELADDFRKMGGEYLYLDEVHKYSGWARELKSIYDDMPGLKLVFSGSSILELSKQDVDLSRRALIYELGGLSFREYLMMSDILDIPQVSFSGLLQDHLEISTEVSGKIPILKHYADYLRKGVYPYFLEKERDYLLTLEQIIRTVVESDLSFVEKFDITQSKKILTLLKVIAASAPFKPNISKISQKTALHRHTVLVYLEYLEKVRLIRLLNLPDKFISRLQKPDKIFLDNPNLFFALNPELVNVGSIRETFAISQLVSSCEVSLHEKADFLIDQNYVIEIGGPNKDSGQIKQSEHAFLFIDGLETGSLKRIPLWMLGLLY